MKFRDIDEDVIAHVKNCEYCQNLVHQSFDNCCIPVGGKEFVELTYEVDKFFSHTVGCRTCSEILNLLQLISFVVHNLIMKQRKLSDLPKKRGMFLQRKQINSWINSVRKG